MLVEEITTGNIPKHLELTLSSLKNPDINDYVVALLYTLMIETGFTPADVEITFNNTSSYYGFNALKLNKYNKLPMGWKNEKSNSYEIKFQIGPCTDHSCKLLVLLMQDLLVIDLFIENKVVLDDETLVSCYTMTVCPSMHLAEVGTSTVPVIEFTDIQTLAYKFKDTIASPARASILTDSGVTNPSLIGLPEEVTLNILRYLEVQDIGTMSRACKFLNELCKDQQLWFFFCKKDLGVTTATQGSQPNWASFYKQKHGEQISLFNHSRPRPLNPCPGCFVNPCNATIDDSDLPMEVLTPITFVNFNRLFKRCRRSNQ